MTGVVRLKLASIEDVDTIVNIHNDAFKDFFLTSLGGDFLKFYYSCFMKSGDGHIFCALCGDRVIGFAAMSEYSKGFNTRLIKKNILLFGVVSLKMLFTSPKSLLRLIRNLKKTSSNVDDDKDYAELFSIGVVKSAQGMGVGKQLLCAVEDYVRSKEISRLSLTTDYYYNDSAISFYRAMQYHEMYDFIAFPNRRMYRFVKEL